jgi:hypothetical protein
MKCAVRGAVDSYSIRNHNEQTPDLERVMIDLAESADDVRMVNSRTKVGQERRLFLQIECQSFVVTLSEVSNMLL